MARIEEQLITRSRLSTGRTEAPTRDLSANLSGVTVTLDPLLSEYDDPSLLITLETTCSLDGGQTYPYVFTTTFIGGSRAKGGGLPFKQYPQSVTVGGEERMFTHAKTAIVLSKQVRIGLKASVER
jgi:hypothetical protein